MAPYRLHLNLGCGVRVELIPVFVERDGPTFGGYRLNVIHAPGAGLVSPAELDQLAELFTVAAKDARRESHE